MVVGGTMKSFVLLAVAVLSVCEIVTMVTADDDLVDCYDYCSGTTSDGSCEARSNITTCKGVACKITKVISK